MAKPKDDPIQILLKRTDTIALGVGRIEVTLAQHTRKLEEHDRRFDALDRRFDEHDQRLERIERKLDRHETRIEALEKTQGT